jgi:hypothetical protein
MAKVWNMAVEPFDNDLCGGPTERRNGLRLNYRYLLEIATVKHALVVVSQNEVHLTEDNLDNRTRGLNENWVETAKGIRNHKIRR